MTSTLWNRVTIVGCGLIGASFAIALKQSGVCNFVAGWDSDTRVLDEALRVGVIDEKDFPSLISRSRSDLFYLAMPVNGIMRFLKDYGSQLPAGAVVTDAGSTKVNICEAAQTFLTKKRYFVGGHPIADSHLSGFSNARADLFEGAPYILIADDGDETESLNRLKETVWRLGSDVHLMNALEHDRAMALLSHLPQLLSNALSGTVDRQLSEDDIGRLSGSGYYDMTRLAGSSWSIWADIFASNSAPIADALDSLLERLHVVQDELRRSGELRELGKLFRQPQ